MNLIKFTNFLDFKNKNNKPNKRMNKSFNSASLTRYLASFVLLVTSFLAYSQCNPKVMYNGNWSSTGVFCLGEILSFDANSPGYNSSTVWDFGDAGPGTSTQEKPSYSYATAGTYTVKYTGTGGAGTCTGTVTVIVRPSPEIHVRQLANDTQCFSGNNFCFRDSIVAPDGSIERLVMLFSDGTKVDTTFAGGAGKLKIFDFCVTINDPDGGFFDMVVEAYDTSGCLTKYTFQDYIYVHPKLGIKFDNITPKPNPGCDSTLGVFLNTSLIALADIDSFMWDFGDGTIQRGSSTVNTQWWFGIDGKDTIKHMYTTNGTFNGTLYVSAYGCSETFTWKNAVTNFVVDPKIVSTPNPACVSDNPIEFSVTNFNTAGMSSFLWNFGDPPSGPANFDKDNFSPTAHGYGPGPWMISLRIQQGPCDVTIYDTIQVIGPISTIGVPFDQVAYNQTYQCLITDSVQMVNNSSYYQNDYNQLDEDSIIFYFDYSFDYNFDNTTGLTKFIVRKWKEDKNGNKILSADTFPKTDTLSVIGYKAYFDTAKDSIAVINGKDTVWQKYYYNATSYRGGINGRKRYAFNYIPPVGGKGVGTGDQTAIDPNLNVRDYNPNVWRVWFMDDRYAPQCTTDSRPWVNRNVGINCNWSIDSVPIHWYTPWDDVYRTFNNGQNYRRPKVDKRLFKEDTICYEVNVYSDSFMVVPRFIYINIPADSAFTYFMPYDGLNPAVNGYRDTLVITASTLGRTIHYMDSSHLSVFQQETYIVINRPPSRFIGTEFYYDAAVDSFYAVNNLTDTTVLAADPLGRWNKTAGNGTTRWSTTTSEMSFYVPDGVTITTINLPAPGGGGGVPTPGPSYTGPKTIILPANTQFTLQSKDSLFSLKHIQTVARTTTNALPSSYPYKDMFGKTRFGSAIFVDSALHREDWFDNNAVCFNVVLWQKDTIHPLLCESQATKSLALVPPNAKGLEWVDGTPCPFTGNFQYILGFDMANTKPGCTQSWFAVNYDTVQLPTNQTGSWAVFNGGGVLAPSRPGSALPFQLPYAIVGNTGTQFLKGYTPGQIGSGQRTPAGSFTVGLIVGNGVPQANGLPACLDTAYYPDMFRILYMNPAFTLLNSSPHMCAGATAYFQLEDPIQDSITALRWNWGYPGNVGRGPQQGGYSEEFYYYKEYNGPQANRNDANIAYNGEKWLYNFIVRYNIDDLSGTKLIDTIVVNIIKKWEVVASKKQVSKEVIDLFLRENLVYQDIPAADIPFYLGDGSNNCVDTTSFGSFFQFGIKAYHQNSDPDVWQVGDKRYLCKTYNPAIVSDTTFFVNGSGNRVPSLKYAGVDSFTTIQDVTNRNKANCTSSEEVTQILHFRDSSLRGYDTYERDIDNDGVIDEVITGVYKHTYRYPVVRAIDPCDPSVKDTIWVNANAPMTPNFRLNNTTGCSGFGAISMNVGFYNDFWMDSTAICQGLTLFVEDSIRYYQLGEQDPPTYPIHDFALWQDPARFIPNIETVYYDWDSTDGVWDNYQSIVPNHFYPEPGKYTITIIPKDSTGCRDTSYIDVTISKVNPVISFATSLVNCASIVDFKDSTWYVDPCDTLCPNGNNVSCEKLLTWNWDFGDDTRNSKLQNPSHNFTSAGTFDITLTVTSLLGCEETITRTIYIPGPQPDFEFDLDDFNLNDTATICVGDSLILVNKSKGDITTPKFIMDWGDKTFSQPTNTTGKFGHTYNKAGTYLLFLTQEDEIPGTSSRCQRMFPDTNPDIQNQRRIVVIVKPLPDVKITASKDTICLGDEITFSGTLDPRYTRVKWDMAQLDTINGIVPQDTIVKYIFKQPGTFTVVLRPEYDLLPRCWATDSVDVFVQSVTAAFDIIPDGAPEFCFTNTSTTSPSGNVLTYEWTFEDETPPGPGSSTDTDPCYNWNEHVGIYEVCLIATDVLGCKDTVCQDIENVFQTKLVPYNVFTPNSDAQGLNEEFVIEGESLQEYQIKIFNRWGELVFESTDVKYSWNGKVKNSGNDCPEGTYFYVIKYMFEFDDKSETIEGTVDIIR